MVTQVTPPTLNQIEPAGPDGKRHDADARMLAKPRLDRRARVTGEVVRDQEDLPAGVGLLHGIEQRPEAGGVARRRAERERLAVTRPERVIDPDLVRSPPVVQWGLDSMPVYRPAGCWGKGARTYGTEFVKTEDRCALRWVRVESDDPGPFGPKSGSVLAAQRC